MNNDAPIALSPDGSGTYKLPPTKNVRITPKVEMAIRLYITSGRTMAEVAKQCKISAPRLCDALNSPAGQAIKREIDADLDNKMNSLYSEAIDNLEAGMKHPDPAVNGVFTNMWFKYGKGTKVQVQLSAEDIVQKLINGEPLELTNE